MTALLRKPLVHIGERSRDFCIVTPLPAVAQYAEELAREMNIPACIALSQVDNDVETALEMIRHEGVRLLATRGYPEYILRRKTKVPILAIGYSAENFFETLLPYQNSGMTVGHLCFPGQNQKFMKIAKLLGLKGRRLEVEDRNNLDAALNSARKMRIDLLVGGLGLISAARRKGFHGIPLLAENREEIRQTFLDARAMLAMEAVNAERHSFIRTILDANPDIIIQVDDEYTVAYANNSAQSAFAAIHPELLGIPLSEVFPETDFGTLFTASLLREEPDILTDKLHREFLFEVTRLRFQGGPEGYILSLSSVQAIRKGESNRQRRLGKQGRPPYFTLSDILGKSPLMMRAKSLAAKFAASDAPILIVGATGTGKEMFAQAMHVLSSRAAAPFISLNCASLSETLLESELFGYEEGAFTSARRGGKPGLLEVAHGGTVFLDEIGEMPLAVQARFLRVLQDKMVTRLGGTGSMSVDIRIICATNRNIFAMAGEGQFRADLFYRINTLILRIPALAERREDIPLIANSYCAARGTRLSREALGKLSERVWPGNVRELLHILDRAHIISASQRIGPESICFDEDLLREAPGGVRETDVAMQERYRLHEALQRNCYHRGRTAAELGISRVTLWKRMKSLGLS